MENIEVERHILLVIRHFVGGIRTYIKYIYAAPEFRHCRFTIIAPGNDTVQDYVNSLKNMKIDVVECGEDNISIIRAVFQTLYKDKVDLVHSHGYTSGICSSVPAKLFSIPNIMTAHDVLSDNQFSGIKGSIKKRMIPLFLNLLSALHCVSNDVKNNLIAHLPWLKKNKLVTILNGIDIHQYTESSKRDFHSELGLENDTFIIGFLGRFMSQKGFRYLIDAVEHLSENGAPREFVVIAIGAGGFIREEQALIKQKNIDDKILFLPFVDNVAESIKGVDVIVTPSISEACPLVPMETLVSAKPLIATRCIGLREVIEDTPAFSVKPADGLELATAITECMNDDRREHFIRYQEVAAERYDAKKAASKLYSLYNELLEH